MKWFKHFHDSHESNRIAIMVEKKGLECEARWFRMLSLLTKELDTNNFNASFTLHWEVIGSKLKVKRKQTLVKLLSFWVETGLLEYTINGSFIEIVCPILWELQDKNSKYNRKRVVKKESFTTNKKEKENKNKKENKKENYRSLTGEQIDTFLLDKIKQAWNETCAGHGKLKVVRGTKPSTIKDFMRLVENNRELVKIDNWVECFETVKQTPFLNGQKGGSSFVCTLDWLISSHKIIDVLNGQFGGNYDVSPKSGEIKTFAQIKQENLINMEFTEDDF